MTLTRFKLDDLPPMLASNMRMHVKRYDQNGQPIEVDIPMGGPSVDVIGPKITKHEVQGLWEIAEGTIFPEENGRPGWKLSMKLNMPPGNISSRVTSPLEEKDLICHEYRKTTKLNSAHPKKEEKAWFLKRGSMQIAFDILSRTFFKQNIIDLDLKWPYNATKEEQDRIRSRVEDAFKNEAEVMERNHIAASRFSILALLRKKIDEYENSPQYFVDLGVKPPSSISSKRDYERLFGKE
ncbi:MAG: hypothetical protein ABR985_15685 [Methanotrichaceae archaeon]|jgi:hypothetical protein